MQEKLSILEVKETKHGNTISSNSCANCGGGGCNGGGGGGCHNKPVEKS